MKKSIILGSCVLALTIFGASHAKAAESPTSKTTVSTFAELKSALADNNDITNVILANDIELTAGIRIHQNKEAVEIDAQGHTITENKSSVGTATSNIYVTGVVNTKEVTLKNANIVGNNYYGTIMISASSDNVNYNVENVTYTGPQFIYNPVGYVNFSGKNDFTIQSSTGTAEMQEFAETSGVTISGDFNLTSNTTGAYSVFWFDHTVDHIPFFNVKDNANVKIDSTERNIFYAAENTDLDIGKGANVEISSARPIFDLGEVGNLVIEENAKLAMNRTGANVLTSATLDLNGEIIALPGSTFTINNAPETIAPVIESKANSYIQFDEPLLVDLQTPAQTTALDLEDSTLSFYTNQLNEWVSSDTESPTVSLESPLDAIFAIDRQNKKVVYTNNPAAISELKIVDANRLQFKN